MSNHKVPIPAIWEEAIDAIVELEVARWGEDVREITRQDRRKDRPTYGLALNCLARHISYNFGDDVPHLVAAAEEALTPDDWDSLSEGG